LSLTVLALFAPYASRAAPITVTFSGTIDSHTGTWTETAFQIGDSFSGELVYESTTPGNPFATEFGGIPPERMPYPGAILSFTATSRGETFTSAGETQNGILVDNNLDARDNVFVVLTSSEDPSQLYLDLRSTDTSLFSSQALPNPFPDLEDFDNSAFFRLGLEGPWGGLVFAQGDLDSLVTIPEPSTALLLAFGLTALAAGRHRRAASRAGAR
jgi:hypothetical protein